ncbi:MAG: DNA integrity scanning protein DisA nucleotide-binding domain protein [Candidatus Eremiobacteraeota bacterium]|nr:DNA integrity scanning protein DisA nucleotide-binding domain protein [Candidatus Eremiobacteraeota bacterium]
MSQFPVQYYLSIFSILEGSRMGLSQFSDCSRVSALIAFTREGPLFVFDPQDLLREHVKEFREIYGEAGNWKNNAPDVSNFSFGMYQIAKTDEIPMLISFGAYSKSVFYQMWFTEKHLNCCSEGPTIRWLQHATGLLVNEIALGGNILSDSRYVMQGYALRAVGHHLGGKLNCILHRDSRLPIMDILETILDISTAIEEGVRASGRLIFCETEIIKNLRLHASFDNSVAISLSDVKHIRKLLQAVDNQEYSLLANEKKLVGIYKGKFFDNTIIADFKNGCGDIRFGSEIVCTFRDGKFYSTRHIVDLTSFETILKEVGFSTARQERLLNITRKIVQSARDERHGCTLIIQLGELQLTLAGQKLMEPLDLENPENIEIAISMAKIDGALHIDGNAKLYAFACLLDGPQRENEDRSRGARFNSSLRFTGVHLDTVAIIVSEDGPVSIISKGEHINKAIKWKSIDRVEINPPELKTWLKANGND